MSIQLEVCANSALSAQAAQAGGAVRVELCENLHEGGTTPSYGQIKIARKLIDIPLFVLLRPRAGDFVFNDVDLEIMLTDLDYCIAAGCNGIVTGILKNDSSVDMERCSVLVNSAKQKGLAVTFHRAFDLCEDMHQAIEDIIALGCDYILTSGGKTTAIEGASKISALVEAAAGRIQIMPGGGVSEYNVADLVRFTGAHIIHSSARVQVQSHMTYQNSSVIMESSHSNEYEHYVTDTERVRNIISLANSAGK